MAKVKIVLIVEDTDGGTLVSAKPEIDALPDEVSGAMTLGTILHEGLEKMVSELFLEYDADSLPDDDEVH